jgi:hypothetical protein
VCSAVSFWYNYGFIAAWIQHLTYAVLWYTGIYFLFWARGVAVISPAPEVSWELFVINPDGLKMLAVVHCVKSVLSIGISLYNKNSLIDLV